MSVIDDNQMPEMQPTIRPADAPRALDLVSLQLQRRAWIWALVLVSGLGLGFLTLRLAGEKGSIGWIAVATVATSFLALLTAAYHQRKVNVLMGWMIVAFLSVCWIAIGTPSVAEG